MPVRFYKDLSGAVHIEGTPQTTAAVSGGDIVFTLPTGYRPTSGTILVGAAQNYIAYITPAGDVHVMNGFGSGTNFTFNGTTFHAS